MEALWNLEDKWKLSTQQAFILLTCTVAAVIGLCTAAWVKKRKGLSEKKGRRRTAAARWWCGAESGCGETPVGLSGGEGEGEEVGSRNSTAAVWQRPILMGEKCEMLKYSGLILYDERGRLLQDQIAVMENAHKEGEAIIVKTNVEGTTLISDLLLLFYEKLHFQQRCHKYTKG